eukprot:IDg21038t1
MTLYKDRNKTVKEGLKNASLQRSSAWRPSCCWPSIRSSRRRSAAVRRRLRTWYITSFGISAADFGTGESEASGPSGPNTSSFQEGVKVLADVAVAAGNAADEIRVLRAPAGRKAPEFMRGQLKQDPSRCRNPLAA